MSSTRVIGAELVNSENLSGITPPTARCISNREGDEYEDIFPVWDWRKLPGITCAQFAPPEYRNLCGAAGLRRGPSPTARLAPQCSTMCATV